MDFRVVHCNRFQLSKSTSFPEVADITNMNAALLSSVLVHWDPNYVALHLSDAKMMENCSNWISGKNPSHIRNQYHSELPVFVIHH